jgi:membrane-associated protease RseP (regulator of RpoE activity)
LAGGPAEAAGLQIGDVITAIDGQPVASPDSVVKSVAAKRPGEVVNVTVIRNREALQLRAAVAQRQELGPAQPAGDVVRVPLDDSCARFFCPSCQDLDVRVDAPPTTECLQCYTGFAALIADCRRRGLESAGGAASPGASPAAAATPPAPPTLELDAVRTVPERVPPGGKFAVEITFTARNAAVTAGRLPVSFIYSIEKGGQTVFAPSAETIEAPNSQRWSIVKNLAAAREAGQYTIRVKLIAGNDIAQATTTLVVD